MDFLADTIDKPLREFGRDCRAVDPVPRNIGMDAINQPVQQDFVLTTELLKSQKPEKRFGLCPILLPDSKDYQQDVITAEEIEKAEQSKDEVNIARAKGKKEELKSQLEKWRSETVNTYKMVADKYPNSPNVDAVYYYLGVYLTAMNRSI